MSKLHLVFGGRVTDPRGIDFEDPSALHIVGIYPDYAAAEAAWRGEAPPPAGAADQASQPAFGTGLRRPFA